jgi:hypothetical protein
MVEVQAAYWRKQFGVLTDQAEEVRALLTKVMADTAAPMKAQMARHGNDAAGQKMRDVGVGEGRAET